MTKLLSETKLIFQQFPGAIQAMFNTFSIDDLLPVESVDQTRAIYIKRYSQNKIAAKAYLAVLQSSRKDTFLTRKFYEENVLVIHFRTISMNVKTLSKYMQQVSPEHRFQLFTRAHIPNCTQALKRKPRKTKSLVQKDESSQESKASSLPAEEGHQQQSQQNSLFTKKEEFLDSNLTIKREDLVLQKQEEDSLPGSSGNSKHPLLSCQLVMTQVLPPADYLYQHRLDYTQGYPCHYHPYHIQSQHQYHFYQQQYHQLALHEMNNNQRPIKNSLDSKNFLETKKN